MSHSSAPAPGLTPREETVPSSRWPFTQFTTTLAMERMHFWAPSGLQGILQKSWNRDLRKDVGSLKGSTDFHPKHFSTTQGSLFSLVDRKNIDL